VLRELVNDPRVDLVGVIERLDVGLIVDVLEGLVEVVEDLLELIVFV